MDSNSLLKKYEKAAYTILTVLFAIIVTCSIAELMYLMYVALVIGSPLILENGELLEIFGYFLLVLIGVELLSVTSAYINERVIHVEVVIIIAIIAVARGIILLETSKLDPLNMFGTAALIFTLCTGYYFLKKAGIRNP